MQLAILLSNSIFAAFLLILCVIHKTETTPCDTKWVRLIYMLSCGKKKRESVSMRNVSFSDPLPTDVYGAVKYFRDRDPTNPLFNDDGKALKKILEEHDNQLMTGKGKYKKLHISKFVSKQHSGNDEKWMRKSGLMKRIIYSPIQQNQVGIPGFPEQWDYHDVLGGEINEHHRREINKLIEECCKTGHESSCNGDTFRGACK